MLAESCGEETGEGCLAQVFVQCDVGIVVKIDERGADAFTNRTGRMRRVAVDFGSFAFRGCLTDAIESNLSGGLSEHPTASASRFRSHKPVAAQAGKETADDDGVGADADGNELRSEALAGPGLRQEAEDVDGEREAGIHSL